VDFAAGEIRVRQRTDRYNQIGRPKSESSERSVRFPPSVASTLKEWKLACPHGELVFPNGVGRIESLANIINRGLIPTQIEAKVVKVVGAKVKAKYTGMHCLRHFYASWALAREKEGGLGYTLHMVKERMGHSSIAITANTYGHLLPSETDTEEFDAAARQLLG
jgi:integrase